MAVSQERGRFAAFVATVLAERPRSGSSQQPVWQEKERYKAARGRVAKLLSSAAESRAAERYARRGVAAIEREAEIWLFFFCFRDLN